MALTGALSSKRSAVLLPQSRLVSRTGGGVLGVKEALVLGDQDAASMSDGVWKAFRASWCWKRYG